MCDVSSDVQVLPSSYPEYTSVLSECAFFLHRVISSFVYIGRNTYLVALFSSVFYTNEGETICGPGRKQ